MTKQTVRVMKTRNSCPECQLLVCTECGSAYLLGDKKPKNIVKLAKLASHTLTDEEKNGRN